MEYNKATIAACKRANGKNDNSTGCLPVVIRTEIEVSKTADRKSVEGMKERYNTGYVVYVIYEEITEADGEKKVGEKKELAGTVLARFGKIARSEYPTLAKAEAVAEKIMKTWGKDKASQKLESEKAGLESMLAAAVDALKASGKSEAEINAILGVVA